MPNPSIAITENDKRKLNAWAINPINGGPNRNPRNPIEETAVNARPGESDVDLPAVLYTKGTTEDTPNPTNKNPIVAEMSVGKITETNSPSVMMIPLICNTFCFPILFTNQSPMKRPPAIVPIKAAYPKVINPFGASTTFWK